MLLIFLVVFSIKEGGGGGGGGGSFHCAMQKVTVSSHKITAPLNMAFVAPVKLQG